MRTTVYAIIDSGEDSMGCSCCKMTTVERIHSMWFEQDHAVTELESLAKEDENSGYTIKWEDENTRDSYQALSESGYVIHEYTINALEVQ